MLYKMVCVIMLNCCTVVWTAPENFTLYLDPFSSVQEGKSGAITGNKKRESAVL
jgi:hypothetical protein